MEGGEEKRMTPSDWIRERVAKVFRHVPEAKFKKAFESKENQSAIEVFLSKADVRVLAFGNKLRASHVLTESKSGSKGVYFLKPKSMVVHNIEDMKRLVFSETSSKKHLDHLENLLSQVYVPLLSNVENQEGWGDVVSREIMNKVHSLLNQVTIIRGQKKGETNLPLPPIDLSGPIVHNKERIYLLESAVVTWTKQIRNILKQDPEMMLKQGQHPTPDAEIAFWKRKASNLNSVFKQLQSEKVRRVLKFLDQSKSTYCQPFAKLCKDVFQSREAANDNNKFLSSLEDLFGKLNNPSRLEFESLARIFKPIMLTILLIWKHSHHYNTPPRLVVMVREICNAVIKRSQMYLSGEELFRLLETDRTVAVRKLQTMLKVCGTFKSTYFEYKARSATECPHNSWRVQNNALFLRLDSFLERCHDILDLTQTIVQFSKIEKIEIGGTKGKTLSTSVRQIFSDFTESVSTFKKVPYDVIDVSAKQFDDDFYEFRCKVKMLERRLSSIITQAFDDSATMFGKFKLLDSFRGLLDRPIIADELERKHRALIAAYSEDLQLVGDIFLRQRLAFENRTTMSEHAGRYMPPIAGALGWIHGLIERIKGPYMKLLSISSNIMEKDEGKDVVKSYKATMTKLREFANKQIAMLGSDLEAASMQKLKQTLLRRDPKTRMLDVNFDPTLVALLREVKYFLLAGHSVPETALSIYRNVETYRQYTGQLELIVNAYNHALDNMIDVERPLMANHFSEIDRALRAGLKVINWKSHGIKKFLDNCHSKTQSMSKTLHTLKRNVESIRAILDKWGETPMIQRRNKPCSVEDFNREFYDDLHTRYEEIRRDGEHIHELVNQSNKALHVSKGLPAWRDYVSYINDIVVDGMRKVIRNSLKYLEEQISPESIEKKCKTPMIELQLDLYAEKPMFVPDIQHEYKPPTSEVSFVEIVTSENQSDLISITFVLSNGKSFPLSLSNNEVEQDTKKDEKKKTESYVFELKRNEYVTSVMGAFDEHKKVFDFIELVTSTGRRQRYSMSTSKDAETFELKSPPGHMIQSITRFKNNRGSISASFGVVAGNLLLNTVEIPDSSNSDKKTGIRDTIELWIGRFFDVAKMFPRLDFHSKKSDYIADVFDKSLEDIIEQIRSHAQVWSNKCEEYRTKYKTYEALWTTDLQEMIRSFVSKAVQKTPLGQNMPDLEKFEEALRTYKEKQSEIDCMPTPKDIGWLRISAMPIKQALCTYTNKWIFAFTSYLSDYVMNQVNSFHEFVELTKKGLSENVPEDDPESLMRVMSVISRVRIRMGTTRELFEPLNSTVKLLRDVGIDMDIKVGGDMVVVDYLDVASTLWDSLVNDTFVKKEKILPLQNTEADKVKAKIASFNTELEAFYKSFRASNLFTYSGESEKAFKDIEEKKAQLDTINVKAERLARLEELFELPITKRSKTEVVSKDLSLLKKLWTFKRDMTVTINKWKTIQWKDIDTDDLEDRVSEFSKEIRKIGQIDVVVKGWQVFKDIQARCKNLSEVIPLINELHTPAMRERHWKALAIETNTTSIPYKEPSFCLKNLLDLNLHLCVEDVEDILDTAKKEFKIETKLSTIEAMWTGTHLVFEPFKKDPTVCLLKVQDEVMDNIESHSVILQSIISMGRFADFFRNRVEQWQKGIGMVELVLKMWINVMQQWSSLYSIFKGSADIQSQLPETTAEFTKIDQRFRKMMELAQGFRKVKTCCESKYFHNTLKSYLIPKLESCQKDLSMYLDEKKKIFPRFYFLSEPTLLAILSNGSEPKAVVPYIGDCYGNLKSVHFDPDEENVAIRMQSKDGEIVDFDKNFVIDPKKGVENYLNDLTKAMQSALQNDLFKANDTALQWEMDRPRDKWVSNYAAQTALTSSLIYWTEETELAFQDIENGQEDAMKNYQQKCTDRLQALIRLVQGKLSNADRTKIITMITMDVHSRDVIAGLVNDKVESMDAFQWQKQLRYYWIPDSNEVDIRITDFFTKYSYEYVGNTGRLVITPLTDRCYITLTMALRLMLGGAPAGPAGTGKTETTKDLARALALPVYVFNCSDQMNFLSMANTFKGLAQTGAWGCFDEFNRIPIEVLSVVATQVKSVLDAIVTLSNPQARPYEYQSLPAGQPPNVVGTFNLQGDEIKLIPTTGFFITMNPGYAGRTELPENVKALFRSCAMIRPDLEPICENMLMAEGFEKANELAGKFVKLYKLSSELLSSQAHYDWGLRSVKSVLRVAGNLKRMPGNKNLSEEAVLMRALRDFNTPKMPNRDIPIFLRLVQDLFPKSHKTPRDEDSNLEAVSKIACEKLGLQCDSSFSLKLEEFQNLLDVRHSVMLIGPAGCGKTTIWKGLMQCWNCGYRQPSQKAPAKPIAVARVLNPKSLTSNELYGHMTLQKEWKDGALSIIMRGMSRDQKTLGFAAYQQNKWVVLDGDIDAGWIESMNTVMDANKVLTLVSNERVPLTDEMRMIFEVNSLENATPATVSRAGILYINESDIGWMPYVESWVANNIEAEKQREFLPTYFSKYIEPLRKALRKTTSNLVPVRIINQVTTVCRLLDGLLPKTESNLDVVLNVFAFALIWAMGGALKVESRSKFHEIFTEIVKEVEIVSPEKLVEASSNNVEVTVFDFYYDLNSKSWKTWSSRVEPYYSNAIGNGPGETPWSSIYVNTVSSTQLTTLISTSVSNRHPVLLVGNTGTGKSAVIKQYLSTVGDNVTSCTINMNYYVDSASFQDQIECEIDRRSGTMFGPPAGKTKIFFVDDLNLPYVEELGGTQNALSLLRQIMDHGTMYDKHDLSVAKQLTDCMFLSAMNPTQGSFTINERVQRQFVTLNCAMPTQSEMRTMFGQIISGHMETQNFDHSMTQIAPKLVEASIALHDKISSTFLPSSTRYVYNWNVREISSVFEGLVKSRSDTTRTPDSLVRLWAHESNRVYGDRLLESDISKFSSVIQFVSKKYFDTAENFSEDIVANIKFSSCHTQPDEKTGENPYDEVKDEKMYTNLIREYEAERSESNPSMRLVLFKQAVDHVSRITRIISTPGGSAMLVGVGGSGKQSLTRLAACILGYRVVQRSTESISDFKQLMQYCITLAGPKNTPFVFILNDTQVFDDRLFVYINSILSCGWASGIFDQAELENSIFAPMKRRAKLAGIPDTPSENLKFLFDHIRRNMHIVLCMSPVGDTLRTRVRRFPALMNCVAIDRFHSWSQEALVSVARARLENCYSSDESKDGDRSSIEDVAYYMAQAHVSVQKTAKTYQSKQRRNVYVTPKSFLGLISFYRSLLSRKREELDQKIDRLEGGVSKLKQTESDVKELQLDLQTTLVKVEEKKKATEILLEQMGKQRGEAKIGAEKARVEREAADKAAAEAAEIEREAEKELEAAKPAMEKAQAALDCLDKANLTELRSLKTPPAAVLQVTKCVLMMLEKEYRNHKWSRAKKMMLKTDAFLARLKSFDARTMTSKLVEKLGPIVTEGGITTKSMQKSSVAAANLWGWVENTYTYNRIFVKVKPLMDRLEEAKRAKTSADEKLVAVKALLKKIENQLEQLQVSFIHATNEKAEVEAEAATCVERINLAERLVNGLASEKERWGNDVLNLKLSMANVEGDCLITAAFASYIGGFDSSFRESLWKKQWMKDIVQRDIPMSKDVDPLKILAGESSRAKMIAEGLPTDRISLENGALIDQCERWPLIIDPQLQGIKWLRSRFNGENLSVTQQNDKDFVIILKEAVSSGQVLIIENVDEDIDPVLAPVLARDITKRGRSWFIKIGDEQVQYDIKNFKMFLLSKISNPEFGPEIQAQTTLINFIATEQGLEEQLLGRVVSEERADLEAQKMDVQDELNSYSVKLMDLESELLNRLASAPDDILSDVKLIEGLEETKATVNDITKAVKTAKETECEINQSRDLYRPVACEGSMLYFILTKLSQVNHMYRYSLGAFMKYFYKGMSLDDNEEEEENEDVSDRVAKLVESIRLSVFTWVSQGLFEDHKLIFLCQIAFTLMMRGKLDVDEELRAEHFDFLIRRPAPSKITENPIEWLPNSAWQSLMALAEIEEFTNLPTDIEEASSRFLTWFNHPSPENEALPLGWASQDKTPFKKLLVISSLRPDRLTVALKTYIQQILPNGSAYTECGAELNSLQILQLALEDSNPTVPIYFVLSAGTDVVSDLDRAALECGLEKGTSYHNVSMGQGQDVIAERLLDLANKEGHWLILNNVHLMPKWLDVLEKMLDDFALDRFERLRNLEEEELEEENDPVIREEFDKRDRFRLFLTSEPSESIPSSILNRAIKLIFEAPRGLKANLKRAFCSFSVDTINDMEKRTRAVLFGLCHFHSLMTERKKFGTIGFNMSYPFSLGDLRDSAVCLTNYMEESSETKIPWTDIRYIFGQIMYGGHIVNDHDRLLCMTYLEYILDDDILEEKELCPFNADLKPVVTFVAPPPTTYERYLAHIDNELSGEPTELFGLHSNAEIDFRTTQSLEILRTIHHMSPSSNIGSNANDEECKEDKDEVQSPQHVAENMLNDILECIEISSEDESYFDIDEITNMMDGEQKTPYQNVFLQECEMMNTLISCILSSLKELERGFAGELNMSDSMESLMMSLYDNRVPAKWETLSWPSKRNLGGWISNLQDRLQQLSMWASDPNEVPHCTWISGLINPQSFLTAVMQVAAQEKGMELDKLMIVTECTKLEYGQINTHSREGCYIHGLSLEGARWDRESGTIERSRAKEMFSALPVVVVKAVPIDEVRGGVYKCPVYKTQHRGPTYVFDAQLRTKQPASRWIMGGVALIMDVVE